MPTNRRRRRHELRTDASRLDFSIWWHLVHGRPMICEGYKSLDEMAGAWRELRDIVLPLWKVNHPGTRPFAWWAVEGHERRLLTRAESAARVKAMFAGSPPSPGGRPPDAEVWVNALPPVEEWAERTREHERRWKFGVLHTSSVPPLQESEREYLDRRGLMAPEEHRSLAEHTEYHALTNPRDLWDLAIEPIFDPRPRDCRFLQLKPCERKMQQALLELLDHADRSAVLDVFGEEDR